ncbi:PREDICTED: 28S ribosomal protein S34, mitochondrial [Charadrius vociferus]|uniref:28S ribosomal protein S34, mitochondrial n=1 Tax=Charadrius vociferus TaxID=50402 RepID=UPI0005219C6E|nr:PREDICTED: 28S ribosomal protein S34, mitochondrial [Charadrius vociferus]
MARKKLYRPIAAMAKKIREYRALKKRPREREFVVSSVVHCHLSSGKTKEEMREIDKVMYHDWRVVPKHEEEAFKKFTSVPEETIRYLPYPPLLRAMILAQWQKEGKPITEEPMIDLEKVMASPLQRVKKKGVGTPV